MRVAGVITMSHKTAYQTHISNMDNDKNNDMVMINSLKTFNTLYLFLLYNYEKIHLRVTYWCYRIVTVRVKKENLTTYT